MSKIKGYDITKRPSVTVIIDGQYGSCGKGVICGYLANEFDCAVRVGGPNAGHTLVVGRHKWKFQQIPVAGLINEEMSLFIGAAGLINEEILKREMKQVPHVTGRLFIDRNAGIITEGHRNLEEMQGGGKRIGSTCEGVGAALIGKIRRDGHFQTAKDIPWLKSYIINVSKYLNMGDRRIMIEGTQGYALSLNHGPYPFCTGRDILASSMLSDVGLAPSTCDHTIMVVRTYPIRVAGNSGPMCGKELTWDEVRTRSGYATPLKEITTVTKKVRRVCEFDIGLVQEACLANRPTQIALTFVDYLDYRDKGKREFTKLTDKSQQFVYDLERDLGVPVTLIKTGIGFNDIIDMRRIKLGSKGFSDLFDEGNAIQ